LVKTTVDAPDKIIIVAGPSFGQALKFMLLGASVGAGAVYYLVRPNGSEASKKASLKSVAHKYEAGVEDFTAAGTPVLDATHTGSGDELADRIGNITSRLKSIGSRAKTLVGSVSEAVKPTLESAIAEGKKAAAEVQTVLKKDVDEAGDGPAIAEQDGELPSEKEDKMVE
jgi:gas vesicle protein